MRIWITAVALLSFAGFVYAEELDDSYTAFKEAAAAKNADQIKKMAPETYKLAKTEEQAKEPADASLVDNWKQRIEFAKQVENFVEYTVYTTTLADAKPTDDLLELNAKSTYLNTGTPAYLAALGKNGGSKAQIAAANKILAANPNNEDALFTAAEGSQNPALANRLITLLKTKAKPEGVADADWTRKKDTMTGHSYFIVGVGACRGNDWGNCDRTLRTALPMIAKEPAYNGQALFYLGLANYQLGKLINDRSKIAEAARFSEQAAAIPGPLQAQASQNAVAMKREAGTAPGATANKK